MLGPSRKKGSSAEIDATGSDCGLMVRAIEEIFQHIEMAEDPNSCKVILFINYVFIFKNNIK